MREDKPGDRARELPRPPERRSGVSAIAKVILAAALAAISASLASADSKPAASLPAAASSPRGTVVFFEGEVRIDGERAEIGRELGARTRIETGKGASCEIVFSGKNAIRIGQDSKATLDFTGIVKELRLERGGATSVLRKIGKIAGKDSFRVRTPAAVAGVRGTSFCVWAGESSTYVCACNGEIRTIDAAGSNELRLKSAHHSGRYYARKGSGYYVAPAGLEYHDDAGVESLAARIGERVDWSEPD
jgi:ferric-dicitrate binding protein FerR (iron transport regulator)